ncbi:uncharacterized protein LOC133923279 [Phragmites australis]|uniref:uncharacterized protein LOC133923279 n=1 Tax=Phragmites australis TaxID=29695 RepID=UPI002D767D9F|nr:uncharacterized protein LOC133923279 [Phragmites australis]
MGSLGRSSSSSDKGETAIPTVDAEEACALLSSGHQYLDVRMWEDFDKGHVAAARNVPYYLSVSPHGTEKNPHFVEHVAALYGKDDRFIVGCRSGSRSKLATADLLNAEKQQKKQSRAGSSHDLATPFFLSSCGSVMAPPPHESDGSSPAAEIPAVVTADVTAARDLVTSAGHRYLDVRTEEELSKGHLENTLNVPYMFITPQGRMKNPAFVERVASLFTKQEHVVVGCQSGKRSELACIDLQAAGFKNVKNMGGGYIAWVDNGFPVHIPDDKQATPTPNA